MYSTNENSSPSPSLSEESTTTSSVSSFLSPSSQSIGEEAPKTTPQAYDQRVSIGVEDSREFIEEWCQVAENSAACEERTFMLLVKLINDLWIEKENLKKEQDKLYYLLMVQQLELEKLLQQVMAQVGQLPSNNQYWQQLQQGYPPHQQQFQPQSYTFLDCTKQQKRKNQEDSSTQNKKMKNYSSADSGEDQNTKTNEEEGKITICERLYIEFPSPDFEVELEVYYGEPEATNFLCWVSLQSISEEEFKKHNPKSTTSVKHNAVELKSKLRTEFVSQFKAKEKDSNITDEKIKAPPEHTKFHLKINGEMFHLCSKPIQPCVNVIEFDETKKATLIQAKNYTNTRYPETIIKINKAQLELFDLDDLE